jgi:hypothetical protein
MFGFLTYLSVTVILNAKEDHDRRRAFWVTVLFYAPQLVFTIIYLIRGN